MACVALVPVLFVRRVTPVVLQLHCLSVANNYNYDNHFLYLSQYPPINNTNYYKPNNSWLLYHNIINKNNSNSKNYNNNNNNNEDHHHHDSAMIKDYNATLDCIQATPLIGHHNILSTILRTAGGSHDDYLKGHGNDGGYHDDDDEGGHDKKAKNYDNDHVRKILDSLPFNLNTVLWLERVGDNFDINS